MNGTKKPQLPSDSSGAPVTWTSVQAYVLAVFTLLLGVALGYLFRGSASLPAQAAPAAATQQESVNPKRQAEAQAVLEQNAAPLLDALNKNSSDYDSLVKLGNLYYDAQQFTNAIQYYERALAIHPENPDVRTDMGTAYWYSGNADKALAEMGTALRYRPDHAPTLFNLGWIKWQGKGDPKGAVEAWEKLLKTTPDYPQRQQVEQNMAKAKEQAARG
jgi:cytochrome c-type biogenesis protein CcmH/NrfG